VNAKDGFHSELALIDKTLSDTRDSKEHNEGVLACVQMLRGQNASHQIRTKRIELQTQGLRSEWLSAYVLAAGPADSVCRPRFVQSLLPERHPF
jgi:hypothetical protein